MNSPLTNAMTVNPESFGFMMERLGQDCGPMQFLREFTQNALDAIEATPDKRGAIVWTRNDEFTRIYGAPKLCVVDSGVGMTGDEMVANINRLAASGKRQALDANFGMGAKISAASRNPIGIVYMSWKAGVGNMLQMWRDPTTGAYGIKRQWRGDAWHDYLELSGRVKPAEIDQHGTVVVLLGKTEDENTVVPDRAQRWLQNYLNGRYFSFPAGVEVYCRGIESYSRVSERSMIRIYGQGHLFEMPGRCVQRGSVDLDDAQAHWMLLSPEAAESTGGRFGASKGHVAALYRNEIYHLLQGPAAYKLLRDFEILYAQSEIAIYIEPSETLVSTDTARSRLNYLGGELPWEDWGRRFAAKMPEAIKKRIEEVAGSATRDEDSRAAIKKRIQRVAEWFKISRYRPCSDGEQSMDLEAAAPGGGAAPSEGGGGPRPPRPGPHHRPGGNDYSSLLKDEGEPAKPVRGVDPPVVDWVSAEDGSRSDGSIEDRAAVYCRAKHTIQANSDFRVFRDIVSRWVGLYRGRLGVEQEAWRALRGWVESALMEAVTFTQSLRSEMWHIEHVEKALSEEALTAVVMQPSHIDQAVRVALSAKFGRAEDLSAAAA